MPHSNIYVTCLYIRLWGELSVSHPRVKRGLQWSTAVAFSQTRFCLPRRFFARHVGRAALQHPPEPVSRSPGADALLVVPVVSALRSLLNPARFLCMHVPVRSAGFDAPSLRLVIGFRWCPLSLSPGDAAAAAAERCAAAAAAAATAASCFWSRRLRRSFFFLSCCKSSSAEAPITFLNRDYSLVHYREVVGQLKSTKSGK